MGTQAGGPVAHDSDAAAKRDPAGDYRRFLAILAGRARRLGSRDPESAAQEVLKRSMGNTESRLAVEYYFAQEPATGGRTPEWALDHLLAWLHAVLHNVVREERRRAGYHREVQHAAGSEWDEKAN